MHAATEQLPATPTSFLQRVVQADGVICAVSGIALLIFAGALADPLGLTVAFLRGTGLVLLPFAAGFLMVGSRIDSMRPWVWAVIAANATWAAVSVLLLFTSWIDPTGIGIAFIVAQAAFVAVFAEMQLIGLRRNAT